MKFLKNPLIKFLITFCLFLYILLNIDYVLFLQNLKKMNLYYIPVILFLIFLNYLFSSIRWKMLLLESGKNLSVYFLLKLYFEGAFFNNFLPTSMGGDVYKFMALGKNIDSKSDAFTATFMERFTGFICLVLVSYVGFFVAYQTIFDALPLFIKQNLILFYFFEFMVYFGFWFFAFLGGFILWFLSKKYLILNNIVNSFQRYRQNLNVLFFAVLTSFLVQLIALATQYLVFMSLNVTLPLFFSFAVLPIITLAAFFIPSINGLGVQDYFYIVFFASFAGGIELCLAASVLYHFFRFVISLPGGITYALSKD